jgi:AAA domain
MGRFKKINMELKTASRKKVKIRMNLASPSGFGKTYSALLIAYGMTGDWEKIAVIDTENDSASLYSHLGEFKTIRLDAPYSPDRYIKAIDLCEKAGMEVVIIDSITHVWKGSGGILEYQAALGGRYQDWAKATPLYQQWLNKILHSNCHIITTTRKKQAYSMITEGNRTKVEKAGLEDEIRDGYEYEMTIAFEIINDKHLTRASKDRTGLFVNLPEFVISPETGRMILRWCESGKGIGHDDILTKIAACHDVEELMSLYRMFPDFQESLKPEFIKRKRELVLNSSTNETVHLSTINKNQENGTH